MTIGKIRHRGLRRLYEDGDASGLPAANVKRIRNILAALESAADLSQVATMPGWKLHALKGDRRGQYAISVTANWRITFFVSGGAITDLFLEDYH